MEKLFYLDSLITKCVKNLKNLLHLSPDLGLQDAPPEHFFDIVAVVVLVGPVVEEKQIHELLFGQLGRKVMSAVSQNISERVGVDIVDSVEKGTLLEEILNGVEVDSSVVRVVNILVNIFNDLLLLNLERFSSVFSALRKLDLLLEKQCVLLHHVLQLGESCTRCLRQGPLLSLGFLYCLNVLLV